MAHTVSAKKRVRRNEHRHSLNKSRVSRIRTLTKKVELAIQSGDKEAAQAALRVAQPEIHRGVTKGLLHKNTVARKLSRLAQKIKKI